MSEPAERVAVACPACGEETVHEVLKPGGRATVRCTDCGHVHKTRVERDREVERDVVVSQDGSSFAATTDVPADEPLSVGDEFVLDTPEALLLVRITSLEVGDEARAEEARAGDVRTIWTRTVDNVAVNATVHPDDGRRDESRGLKLRVPGDYEFTVGEVVEFGDERFEIEGIQVRDDAEGYRFGKFDHDGDMVFAKDVKRLYGRDETSTAWSAW